MILITGGTGFIGQELTRQLVSLKYPVRLLLNPAVNYPQLPKGFPVNVAISGINDERNLRAAMKDVQIVFHLVGTEFSGINADYEEVDIQSAKVFSEVAAQMNISHFFYLSYPGADKKSAYSVLRAKGLAESAIQASGVPYTFFRCSPVYGKGDHFTETLAAYIKAIPFTTSIPAGDQIKIQPIWIEDLITCMQLCMDDPGTIGKTINIGGIEILTFRDCIQMIMNTIGIQKRISTISPALWRYQIIAFEQWFKNFPPMYFWTEFLAEDRLSPIDVLPRDFGLMPTRMSQNLSYLTE